MTSTTPTLRRALAGAIALAVLAPTATWAQAATPVTTPAASPAPSAAAPSQTGSFLLTIFLRHEQDKTLEEINKHLRETGYYKKFPPAGVEVVSWYVMMGIGQVVTLRVPAEKLREVNRAIEESAWGGYHTEFYPTYDYKAIAEQDHARALK